MAKQPSEQSEQVEQRATRISLCIPIYGNVPAIFFQHFIEFFSVLTQNYIVNILVKEDNPVCKNRNALVEHVMKKETDYILWLDSDTLVDPHSIPKLIQTMEEKKADIVTGLYFGKSKPYYPVIREFRSGDSYVVDHVPLGQVTQVDGCGMGLCLMRPYVFKTIPYPWFKFSYEKFGYRDVIMAEDLYFCQKAKEYGFKIYCDSSVVGRHFGVPVDEFDYKVFEKIRIETGKIKDELRQEVIEFTGLDPVEVDKRLAVGTKFISEEWRKKFKGKEPSPAEIRNFYKNTEHYITDLASWHSGARIKFDIELRTRLLAAFPDRGDNPPKVLDYGSGIAQNSLILAEEGFDVTAADLDSVTMDFAVQRAMKRNSPLKFWKTDKVDMPPEEKYDAILLLDVIEHIPYGDLVPIVEKLISLKHKDTKIYLDVSFSDYETHPMHLKKHEKVDELLDRLKIEYNKAQPKI